MAIPEQLLLVASKLLGRWDEILDRVSGFDEEAKIDFIDTVRDAGILEKIAEVRGIQQDPENPPADAEQTLDDLSVDLNLLDEAAKASEELGISPGRALKATAQDEFDRLTVAEAERIRAANVQAIVPALLGIGGAVVTTLLAELISG